MVIPANKQFIVKLIRSSFDSDINTLYTQIIHSISVLYLVCVKQNKKVNYYFNNNNIFGMMNFKKI